MPELSVTEDQRDRLEGVRRDVEKAYVDTYGSASLQDAVEYLLDTYTPPEDRAAVEGYDLVATAEYPLLQRVASDVPDVPGSGIDADEMRGRLLSELGPATLAAELDRVADETEREDAGDETAARPGTDSDDATAAVRPDADAPSPGGDADDTSAPPSEEGSAASTSGRTPTTPNRLLTAHDDRWRESDDETPYEVELPDGTTESARTKDDVRRILFRHYS